MDRRILTRTLGSLATAAMLMSGCSGSVPSVPQALTDQSQSAAFASAAASATVSETTAPTQTPEPTLAPDMQAAVSPADAAGSPAAVSYESAIAVVTDQLPGALPLSCSLESEGSQLLWEIEVLSAEDVMYETGVSASDGTLVYARSEDDLPDVRPSEVAVSFTQAVLAAQNLYPEAYLESFSLDRDGRGVVYEVELNRQGTEAEVVINAQTGEIIGFSADPARAAQVTSADQVVQAVQPAETVQAAQTEQPVAPAAAGGSSTGSGTGTGWSGHHGSTPVSTHHSEAGHHG